jgi:hypothetical protein
MKGGLLRRSSNGDRSAEGKDAFGAKISDI